MTADKSARVLLMAKNAPEHWALYVDGSLVEQWWMGQPDLRELGRNTVVATSDVFNASCTFACWPDTIHFHPSQVELRYRP